MTFEDFFSEAKNRREEEMKRLLDGLQKRYGLNFAGNLEKIYQSDTLHKTVEYMRKHFKE